jgi:hypothetical protein
VIQVRKLPQGLTYLCSEHAYFASCYRCDFSGDSAVMPFYTMPIDAMIGLVCASARCVEISIAGIRVLVFQSVRSWCECPLCRDLHCGYSCVGIPVCAFLVRVPAV